MAVTHFRRVGPKARVRKVKRTDGYIVRIFETPLSEGGAIGKVIVIDDGVQHPFSTADELWRILMDDMSGADLPPMAAAN